MFKEKGSFMKMLNDGEQVFAPSVWDCFSAKAAELCGYRAMLLSGAAVSKGLTGMPDLGLMTADELIYVTERIADFSPLPLIVDFDEGYGDSPLMYTGILKGWSGPEPRALPWMTGRA